ncbi:hypothetical protein AOC10_01825 [Polynucleobacter asymbioticus]|uniref:DUF3108 domain-containing protein n=1 Tax=Polynucleobacter asymbioticus TaxID=576611 RepID=UPI0008FB4C5C|nr:DUF3108 domain-containing protein [Polynucleobacter asymbioticus]APC05355.1 hypothetical protein AOC10_01825 [Polynucleobacter asymbioticus]
MKNTPSFLASMRLFCLICLSLMGFGALAQSIQFEYDLKITADPAKRAAYLKQSGDAPSPYEQVFNLVKGSMSVATIVDKVDLRKDQYHINSTGTLGSVLATVLADQKLLRDSVGSVTKDGMLTNTYQEKRGNTELLIARVEKNVLNFYKVSSRTPPVGSASFSGRLFDMLTVGYQFLGRDLPTKSVTLPVTDGRSLKTYTLVRGEAWDFPFDNGKVRAIRYYKTTSKDDSATFEVWFSEKEHVPLRSVIGLNAQYGATIQVDLKKIPAM